MDSVIQKKYFIGKSKPGTWSSVYTYKPSSQSIRDKRGEIFAAISLEGPKDYGLPTVGNMLLDKFHESYFENAQDTPLISLEKAAIDFGKYLQKFLENDSAGETGIDLNFISLVVFKDLVYAVGIGNGSLLIHRDGQITDVSEILKDPTMEGIIKEASFVTKANDVYFVGTPKTRTEIMHKEFSSVAEVFNEQSLRNHMYKDESQIAFMMVGVNIDRKKPELSKQVIKEEKPEKPEVIVQEVIEEKIPEVLSQVKTEEEGDETLADLLSRESTEQTELTSGKHFGQEIELLKEDELEKIDESLEKDEIETPIEQPEEAQEEVQEQDIDPLQIPPKQGLFSRIKTIFSRKPKLNDLSAVTPSKEDMTYEQEATVPARTTASRLAKQDLKTYQVVLIKIRNSTVNFLKSIKKLVWNNWLGFNNDDLYQKSAVARQRKWGLLIVLVLVVLALLYFSIQGLIESQNQKKIEDTAKLHLDAGVKIVTEVNAQADILAKASGNSERKAAELVKLTNAQTELDQADTVEKYKTEVTKQEGIIQSIKDKFDRIIPLLELSYLVDFAGKFPNANIIDMVWLNNKLYVIDAKYQKLYSVDYEGNVLEIISGLNNPRSITADDKGNLIILDSDPDKAIAFVDPVAKTITRMSATSNSKLSGVSQIEFYTLSSQESRIYLLNNTDKAIGYYSRTGSSYGTYVQRNTMDEFATAKDIEIIDDRIYLLMQKNLGLYRDYNKKEDTINVTGLKSGENLLSATALYVDGTYVYVADPTGKRVLVFTKGTPEIPLLAQYVYRGSDSTTFSDFKEINVDVYNNKIFVLSNSRIFVLDLGSVNSFKL